MTRVFLASAVALALTAGVATAQTTTSQTTTTVAPALVAPPVGTLSVTRTQKTIGSDGSETDSTRTTYRNSNGVADDSVTKTTTFPAPAVITSYSKSTSTTTTTQ